MAREVMAVPDGSRFLLFVAAALALLAIPGPAVVYVVAQSLDRGRRAGVLSVLGVHVGSLVHVTAAAVGLSQLLVSSAAAYAVVRYAGAAYLLFLGIRRLLGRDDDPASAAVTAPPRSTGRMFRQGIVVNVLNPKTALFFLALLPQFVDVEGGHVSLQILVLGATFVVLGLITDSLWALAAGTMGRVVRRSVAGRRAERMVSGSVFVALGAATAMTGRGSAPT